MKKFSSVLVVILVFFLSHVRGQDSLACINSRAEIIKGYHIGVVQPLLSIHQGKIQYVNQVDFYSIGFPLGITFNTSGKMLVDLEFVPFVKPYLNDVKLYEVNLLFHPGILMPLGGGFTFGLRAAFEIGQGQFGFTPLLNKSFKLKSGKVFFLEGVAPGRWGPEKDSGFSQILGMHIGLGF
ncbi:MAG: hypothetical protein SH818_10500 [Saprospiraceae bacterium]|nr:hypothetical protein [Saprospiraceae bacterium]